MRPFFSFLQRYVDLGVGTRGAGLRQFQTLPADVPYMGGTGRRKWNIERSLGPQAPGFMIWEQKVVPVTLRGSGLGISGQYVLQTLVDQKES